MSDRCAMSGHCYRCVAGARPEEWCEKCPNKPKPTGRTWAEEAIERWEAMEPGDDATRLLHEIMREHWKERMRREPRRLFKGTVMLRRIQRNEARKERTGRLDLTRYYKEGGRPWATPGN